MNAREEHMISSMTTLTGRFYVWVAFLSAIILTGAVAYVIQLRNGLQVTGLRDQVSWGLYISSFVFWVGVSKGGTMISAILRITSAGWRRPITRLSEAITVLALLAGFPMIVADLGRPDRVLNLLHYGRIQSPLIWDFISVNTYLMGCILYFYLPLIPDLAILSQVETLAPWRRKLYRALSFRFRGTPQQVEYLERAIKVLAIAVIPLAVSVHTVVSWIFAMTLRPGWNSSIYGPYFVMAAIYSGAAAVIVSMWILRRVYRLENYIGIKQFRNLGLMLIAFALLYLYFNINEYLVAGYKLEQPERDLIESLFTGRYAHLFWLVQSGGLFIPILMLVAVLAVEPLKRFTIPVVGWASLLVVVGAWAKRFLIVVPTLQTPFLPAQRLPAEWTSYRPTWIEWSIVLGVLAAFLLLYSIVTKIFPIVSFWETREEEHAVPAAAPAPAHERPGFRKAYPGFAILAILGILAFAAPARASAKSPEAARLELSFAVSAPETAEVPSGILPSEQTPAGGLTNPFGIRPTKDEPALPTLVVTAKLLDADGHPGAFKPVSFSAKTTFGNLSLGMRPTDANGQAVLRLGGRRYGTQNLKVSFAGDDELAPADASGTYEVTPRPPPALPDVGVLITPYPTFRIAAPFLFFFGGMWVVFFYIGYLIFWKMRRSGLA